MAFEKGVGWLGNSLVLIIWDGLFSAAMFELGRVFILIDQKRWMYWSQPIEVEEIQHPWRQDSTRLFPLRSTIFKAIPVRNLRPSQTPPPLVETHGDAQRKWGLESCKIVTHWMQHEAIIALGLPWANARCVCVCQSILAVCMLSETPRTTTNEWNNRKHQQLCITW